MRQQSPWTEADHLGRRARRGDFPSQSQKVGLNSCYLSQHRWYKIQDHSEGSKTGEKRNFLAHFQHYLHNYCLYFQSNWCRGRFSCHWVWCWMSITWHWNLCRKEEHFSTPYTVWVTSYGQPTHNSVISCVYPTLNSVTRYI